MQQPHDSKSLKDKLSITDLSSEVERVYQHQLILAHNFARKQKELDKKSHSVEIARGTMNEFTTELKQILKQFTHQCKQEWNLAYNQLYSTLTSVIQMYQIRLDKMQDQLAERTKYIQSLELQTSNLREKLHYRQMALLGNDQQIQSLWTCTEHKESHAKLVKISDVIAEYSQNNSVSTYHLNSHDQAITEEQESEDQEIEEQQPEAQNEKTVAPATLEEISQNLSRFANNRSLEIAGKKEEVVKNGNFQVSAILSVGSSQQSSPKKQLKTRKSSLRSSKQNISTSNRINNLAFSKGRTVTVKAVAEPTPVTSRMKMDELRKSLLQRKRSENLM